MTTDDDRPLRPPDTEQTTWDWSEELGEWVERNWTEEELAARTVHTPRPADTAEGTWEETWERTGWVSTQVWTFRPWTPEELSTRAEDEAARQARALVRAIITDLQAERTRLQAVLDVTNSTINSSPAPYIKDVARASLRIAAAALDLARYVG